MNQVDRLAAPLENILSNILLVVRLRPVVIQSRFPALKGAEPSLEATGQSAQRLLELKTAGAAPARADLFRDPAHTQFRLRPSALEDAVANRPDRAASRGVAGGSLLERFRQ